MKILKLFLVLLVFPILVFGCASNLPTDEPNSEIILTTQTIEPYPIPGYPSSNDYEEGYPAFPTFAPEVAYPIITPTKDPKMNGPKFEINKPVIVGSIEVSGTGPANVPIILIDVTEMCEVIGETTIDKNGKFLFTLDEPLQENNSIGIQIGDLSGTKFSYADFMYSEDYIDRPLIGIVFDIASIIKP